MAKILYGVAGEGFGHSSRSELIGQALIDAGHDVIFAASQKSHSYLRSTYGKRVREVFGLSFYCRGGRVHPFRTVLQNLARLPNGLITNQHLFSKVVGKLKPDVVISDFEPFSAWWAWANKVPCISIDHEHLLTCCQMDQEPNSRKERWLAEAVTRGYHTFANAYMILNFFKTPIKNRRAVLVPPVVRTRVTQFQPENKEHLLIYSTDSSPEMRHQIAETVQAFQDYPFFVYGFNEDGEEGNCIFRKKSTEHFLADLASCRAVIATAGFSLLSECLYFRKPMLLSPVQDQYEQILNAYYIEKLQLGCRMNRINRTSIQAFISALERFPKPDENLVEYPSNSRFFELFNQTSERLGFGFHIGN